MSTLSLNYLYLAAFAVVLALSSPTASAHHNRQDDASMPRKDAAAPVKKIPVKYEEIYVDNGGSISGVVRSLSDTAVTGVKDTLVYIKGIRQGKGFARYLGEKETPFIDQKDYVFVPHVTVVPVGNTVEIRNADPDMHNIHSFSARNVSFNEGMPQAGASIRKKFDFVEAVRIGCDVHQEMGAWIVVRDNPYYHLTAEDGSFWIANIPPGTYELAVWHENFDRAELAALYTNVNVEPDREFEVDFYLFHRR